MTNTAQKADWNGQSGDRWTANQERLDIMLRACGDALLNAAGAQSGEHCIDIGCGAGESSFALAKTVGPDGSVIGLDISAPLIARARARLAAQPDLYPILRFIEGDASTQGFARGSADLLLSRFGVMFFDDPVASFANMRNALRADGRLAFICWRGAAENDWVRLPTNAVRAVLHELPSPDPTAPGPFSFGDPARVDFILSEAGFRDIRFSAFDCDLRFGIGASPEEAIEDALDQAFQIGPMRKLLLDQPDDARARAAQAVRAAFAEQATDEGVIINGATWVVTARI